MLLGAQPQFLSTTIGELHKISDEIWWLSGDRSTDMNWYVKRALLMKTYVLTETYML